MASELITPEPSWLLRFVSIVVIALSLAVVSSCLAMIFMAWDPCMVFSGVIFTPPFAFLAVKQYQGTFRPNHKSAKTTAMLLFIISGFAGFAFVTTVGECAIEQPGHILDIFLAIGMYLLAVSLVCYFMGRMNLHWARKLLVAVDLTTRPRFSIRELLGGITVVAVMTAFASSLYQTQLPDFAEHVGLADSPLSLHEDATDISYWRGHRGTIVLEFSSDEASFRHWVKSGIGSLESHWANNSIVPFSEPKIINRYQFHTSTPTGPTQVTVSSGLSYSWSHEDRSVSAIFDSATNRVYYSAQYH